MTTMNWTPTACMDAQSDLWIDDILEGGLPSRMVLLAALALAENLDACQRRGLPDNTGATAVSNNAYAAGWDLGITSMGNIWPDHTGIRFTPKELDTAVRLAYFFVAREQAASDEEAGS